MKFLKDYLPLTGLPSVCQDILVRHNLSQLASNLARLPAHPPISLFFFSLSLSSCSVKLLFFDLRALTFI